MNSPRQAHASAKAWFAQLLAHFMIPIMSFISFLLRPVKRLNTWRAEKLRARLEPLVQERIAEIREQESSPLRKFLVDEVGLNDEMTEMWSKVIGTNNDPNLRPALQLTLAACSPKCYSGTRNVVDLLELRDFLRNPPAIVIADASFYAKLVNCVEQHYRDFIHYQARAVGEQVAYAVEVQNRRKA